MLELRNIVKIYETANLRQVALNDVSVAFRDSEFVAVLGQSGSGKTTMLNVVAAWTDSKAVTWLSMEFQRRTTKHAIGTPTATTALASFSSPTT